jgi:hypothetical protein
MSIDSALRGAISCFSLVLLMAPIACVGPQGPPGPLGPSGSGSGPPYVWICTPAQYGNGGSPTAGNVYIFNGGSATANVAVNILDRNGNNLAGVTVPGSSPAATYPGETGATTSPLAAAHTRDVSYFLPVTGGPGFDGITNVSTSIRVTSDQPIVVGSNFQFSGYHPVPCSLLPK